MAAGRKKAETNFIEDLVKEVIRSSDSFCLKESTTELYEYEPVPLDVFLYDSGYLKLGIGLSDKQHRFLEAMDDINPETCQYEEAVLVGGKGGGKDFISAIFIARMVYLLSCFKSPQHYFGHYEDTHIDIINVAYNSFQARNIFFKYLKSLVKGKKVFEKLGYESLNDSISFNKNICAYSGHSDQEGLEGLNLFAAIMDEASAFKSKEEVQLAAEKKIRGTTEHSAEGIYDILRSSINSRFPKSGKLVLISYPRFSKDFILTKYEEGKSLSFIYVDFGATWDWNPTKKKEDFSRDYERNPERAEAMYECKPPEAENRFFRDRKKVFNLFSKELSPVNDDHDKSNPVIRMQDYEDWFSPSGNEEYVIHVDLGITKDSCGFCMGHLSKSLEVKTCRTCSYTDKEGNIKVCPDCGSTMLKTDFLPTIRIDLIQRITSDPGKEIQISDIRNKIITLRDQGKFNIHHVSFDQYQSTDTLQILKRVGISAERLSVDRTSEAYETLKELVYDERIKCYYYEPLSYELLRLIRLRSGKIDHLQTSSKDVSDAVAGVSHYLVEMYGKKSRRSGHFFQEMPTGRIVKTHIR